MKLNENQLALLRRQFISGKYYLLKIEEEIPAKGLDYAGLLCLNVLENSRGDIFPCSLITAKGENLLAMLGNIGAHIQKVLK